jgi:hypothetical protein
MNSRTRVSKTVIMVRTTPLHLKSWQTTLWRRESSLQRTSPLYVSALDPPSNILMILDVIVPIITSCLCDRSGNTDACCELATSRPFIRAQVSSSCSKVEVRIRFLAPAPLVDPSEGVHLSISRIEHLQSGPRKLGHMVLTWTGKEYL